jgi:alanine dehydrogenase
MTLILSDADVERWLSMEECIEAMRVAFRQFAEGRAVNRPRVRYLAEGPDPDHRYLANVHAGAVPAYGMACVRAGSQILRAVTAGSTRRVYENPQPFVWGIVILYSLETAEPLALVHEYHLSGLRVGATTGLAVDVLARPDASVLALFGSGKQARTNLRGVCAVRPIRRVQVFSPDPAHRAEFAAEMARDGLEVVPVDRPEAALDGADVVVSATTSLRPVFEGRHLHGDPLVVSIANSDGTGPVRTEVDEATVRGSRVVVVNDRESLTAGRQRELLDPIERGDLCWEQVVELGQLLAGRATVPASGPGHVYYKNNSGLAIQFAAAGAVVYRKALAAGGGREIPAEWLGTDLSDVFARGYRPSP